MPKDERPSLPACDQKLNKWGIPDWTDESAYPTARELGINQWRWEFLRRNQDYRKFFSGISDPFLTDEENHLIETFGLLIPVDPSLSVRALLAYPVSELWPAPDFDDLVRFSDTTLSRNYSDAWELPQRFFQHAKPYHLFLRLDLRKPLTPQFNRLQQIARNGQAAWGRARIKKPHTNNWPLYLRALDARENGASYGQIASVLLTKRSSSPQGARDLVNQATALRDMWPY